MGGHPVLITWPDGVVTRRDAFDLVDLWRTIKGKRVRPVGMQTDFNATRMADDQQALDLIQTVWSAILSEADATGTETNATQYPVLIVWSDYAVNSCSLYELQSISRVVDGKHERPKRIVAQFDVDTIPEPSRRDRVKREMLRRGVTSNSPPIAPTRHLKRFEPAYVALTNSAAMQEDDSGRYYVAEDVDDFVAGIMRNFQETHTTQTATAGFPGDANEQIGPGAGGAGNEYISKPGPYGARSVVQCPICRKRFDIERTAGKCCGIWINRESMNTVWDASELVPLTVYRLQEKDYYDAADVLRYLRAFGIEPGTPV